MLWSTPWMLDFIAMDLLGGWTLPCWIQCISWLVFDRSSCINFYRFVPFQEFQNSFYYVVWESLPVAHSLFLVDYIILPFLFKCCFLCFHLYDNFSSFFFNLQFWLLFLLLMEFLIVDHVLSLYSCGRERWILLFAEMCLLWCWFCFTDGGYQFMLVAIYCLTIFSLIMSWLVRVDTHLLFKSFNHGDFDF